jgi:hypothetical protein
LVPIGVNFVLFVSTTCHCFHVRANSVVMSGSQEVRGSIPLSSTNRIKNFRTPDIRNG